MTVGTTRLPISTRPTSLDGSSENGKTDKRRLELPDLSTSRSVTQFPSRFTPTRGSSRNTIEELNSLSLSYKKIQKNVDDHQISEQQPPSTLELAHTSTRRPAAEHIYNTSRRSTSSATIIIIIILSINIQGHTTTTPILLYGCRR